MNIFLCLQTLQVRMTRCLGRRRRDCYWLMYASCLFGAIWWLETTLISRIETGNASIPNKLPNADDTNSQRGSEKLKPDIKRGLRLRNATDSYRPEKPRVVQSTTPNQCTEKTDFVYIKEIKCASQTLVNVFRRFGLERNLSFVTPIGKKIYLGWPWLIQERYYRPSKTDKFNILCEHAIFDERLMRKLMPDDVVFIASLREPFAQFKSMFNYYAFQVGWFVPRRACVLDSSDAHVSARTYTHSLTHTCTQTLRQDLVKNTHPYRDR